MSKKAFLPLFLALIASILFSSTAFAQADVPTERQSNPRRVVGQVISTGGPDGTNQLQVQTRNGKEISFQVDEETRFRDPEGQVKGLPDLKVGAWMAVKSVQTQDGKRLAKIVTVLPASFDPEDRPSIRAAGQITAVDSASHILKVQTRKGEELTFQVNDSTEFLGSFKDLASLQVGMQVAVAAEEIECVGSPLAVYITARAPNQRNIGKVVSVDTASNSFTFRTRKGKTLLIQVDDVTRFRSRKGAIENLADLKVDMSLLVISKVQTDGSLLARLIAAGAK